MADQVVVKEYLSRDMIDAGRKLTLLLEDRQVIVSASLWFYLSESNVWRLMIASPVVSTSGPKELYEDIHTLISEAPDTFGDITLLDISVVEPNNAVVSALGKVLKLQEIGGVRFSKNTVSGLFIEDVYIYKLT
jgi:hypothetical protein